MMNDEMIMMVNGRDGDESPHLCAPPQKIKAAEETNDLGLESMPTVNSWLQLCGGVMSDLLLIIAFNRRSGL